MNIFKKFECLVIRMTEEYETEHPDYSKNHLVSVGDRMANYFRQEALKKIENNKIKFLERKVQDG